MAVATLTSKGQMTLPKEVREALNLRPGDKVEFVRVGDRYELRPRNVRARDLAGVLREDAKPVDGAQRDDAFARALAEDDERIRAGR